MNRIIPMVCIASMLVNAGCTSTGLRVRQWYPDGSMTEHLVTRTSIGQKVNAGLKTPEGLDLRYDNNGGPVTQENLQSIAEAAAKAAILFASKPEPKVK